MADKVNTTALQHYNTNASSTFHLLDVILQVAWGSDLPYGPVPWSMLCLRFVTPITVGKASRRKHQLFGFLGGFYLLSLPVICISTKEEIVRFFQKTFLEIIHLSIVNSLC